MLEIRDFQCRALGVGTAITYVNVLSLKGSSGSEFEPGTFPFAKRAP